MEKVKRQYGLWTGMAMVIGIVIGSGVFIKAGDVLKLAGGDLKLSILAWLIGGVIMVASGFCFAVFATKVTKYNGVVDYVEHASNKKVGYVLAWIMTTFYYPIITSIVALFAGSYFFQMFGKSVELVSWQNVLFAFGVITITTIVNYFSPAISAKFQVSATVIKLIPILIIAVIGLLASFIVGEDAGIINAFQNTAEGYTLKFGDAVKKTAFAYEGWVCATSINAELKDSKRNLPKALVGGTIAILVFYIVYYISLSAILGNAGTIEAGGSAPIKAFETIMGSVGSIIFTFFIMISCLGTVNGLIISCCRGMYTMSCRGQGIAPEKFSKLGKNQSVSLLSCIYGYGCIIMMLLVWVLALNGVPFFAHLGSMDEITCAVVYGLYIIMYIYIMKHFKDYGVFKRFIMPVIAIVGSLFFIICGTGLYQVIADGDFASFHDFLYYLILLFALTIPCIFFYHKENEKELVEVEN